MKNYETTITALPQIQCMKGVWQNDFHEFDVYGHTLDFVRHIKTMTSDDDIIAAGYLHDIGKPVTAKPKMKNGIWLERSPSQKYHTFEDHESIGEDIVGKMDSSVFTQYSLNQARIARLVGVHYEPMKGIKKMRDATTTDEFTKAFHTLEGIIQTSGLPSHEVWMMFLADKLAQGKYCTDQAELFSIRDAALTTDATKKETQLTAIYESQKKAYGGKK